MLHTITSGGSPDGIRLAGSAGCTSKGSPSGNRGKNIVLGKDVIASSVANGSGSELTVDGEKDQTQQCNSADMKNWAGSDTSRDQEEQIPPPVDTD